MELKDFPDKFNDFNTTKGFITVPETQEAHLRHEMTDNLEKTGNIIENSHFQFT